MAAFMVYGFFMTLVSSTGIWISWYIHAHKTGLSPLATGQVKPFLALNATWFMFQHALRPLVLGVSVALTPPFTRLAHAYAQRFHTSPSRAVLITGLFANTVVASLLMGAGIWGAALLAGVPIFPGAM
jgi:hypothetical protein